MHNSFTKRRENVNAISGNDRFGVQVRRKTGSIYVQYLYMSGARSN